MDLAKIFPNLQEIKHTIRKTSLLPPEIVLNYILYWYNAKQKISHCTLPMAKLSGGGGGGGWGTPDNFNTMVLFLKNWSISEQTIYRGIGSSYSSIEKMHEEKKIIWFDFHHIFYTNWLSPTDVWEIIWLCYICISHRLHHILRSEKSGLFFNVLKPQDSFGEFDKLCVDLQKVQEIIRKCHQTFLQMFGMTYCNAILPNGKLSLCT